MVPLNFVVVPLCLSFRVPGFNMWFGPPSYFVTKLSDLMLSILYLKAVGDTFLGSICLPLRSFLKSVLNFTTAL
jgi:hypothetical protein